MKMQRSLSCLPTYSVQAQREQIVGMEFVPLSRESVYMVLELLSMCMASSEGKVSDVHADMGPIESHTQITVHWAQVVLWTSVRPHIGANPSKQTCYNGVSRAE
jgi:hypothetical protein